MKLSSSVCRRLSFSVAESRRWLTKTHAVTGRSSAVGERREKNAVVFPRKRLSSLHVLRNRYSALLARFASTNAPPSRALARDACSRPSSSSPIPFLSLPCSAHLLRASDDWLSSCCQGPWGAPRSPCSLAEHHSSAATVLAHRLLLFVIRALWSRSAPSSLRCLFWCRFSLVVVLSSFLFCSTLRSSFR